MIHAILVALALQPDPAMIRRLFEEALARREKEYGAADPRTAQAASDLGMYLAQQGNAADARLALAKAVRIDEAAMGAAALQTLSDVAELAAISASPDAESLWRPRAGWADATPASRALAAPRDLH